MSIKNYFVVNGCQSLTALYNNKDYLTEDLRVLTKVIEVDPESEVANQVTAFSNNQNPVKARDFVANNSIQIRLQNEVLKHYKGQYFYTIKRGENSQAGEIISNEQAGLYLMVFDLGEPWATHRKYQVFDEKHSALFGRPGVSADRIVLCQVIMECIDERLDGIENRLFGKYALTRFLCLYVIREILQSDANVKSLLQSPKVFVRDKKDRKAFRQIIGKLIDDLIIDLNYEIGEEGEEGFNYRDKLRDKDFITNLTAKLVASHMKEVKRKKLKSFHASWIGKS